MRNTINQQLDELITLIKELKYVEAIEKLYHPYIISCENESITVSGLKNYKRAAEEYVAGISNYKAELKNKQVSDDITTCEWHYSFDHPESGHWDRTQISVQRWKDGKIVHEQHTYEV